MTKKLLNQMAIYMFNTKETVAVTLLVVVGVVGTPQVGGWGV